VIRTLIRIGFDVVREGRRHTILGRGPRLIPVPRHAGDLSHVTFHKILKQAGLTPEEYRRLR
jgi:predicted RNA binding protein YcfA (HicA-like mRNA interferase family)